MPIQIFVLISPFFPFSQQYIFFILLQFCMELRLSCVLFNNNLYSGCLMARLLGCAQLLLTALVSELLLQSQQREHKTLVWWDSQK